MKTTKFMKKSDADRKWYVVDAKDQVLGRMATRVAMYLRGKHKPVFTPNTDTGDFVIIVNADKVRVTGNKVEDKKYYSHSGYIGHLKETTYKERMENCPEEIIRDAVWGMLPKNRLGRQMIRKLKVYAGDKHDHAAQKPEVIDISK
ncbi:MAG: 50S ribosomal protein L13 [Nitrospiraceae bacterium]|jgi:large subunit ribosomal protein L13|nr:50S ribosomal protein L13 [Nitrospiraceae bacterium]